MLSRIQRYAGIMKGCLYIEAVHQPVIGALILVRHPAVCLPNSSNPIQVMMTVVQSHPFAASFRDSSDVPVMRMGNFRPRMPCKPQPSMRLPFSSGSHLEDSDYQKSTENFSVSKTRPGCSRVNARSHYIPTPEGFVLPISDAQNVGVRLSPTELTHSLMRWDLQLKFPSGSHGEVIAKYCALSLYRARLCSGGGIDPTLPHIPPRSTS